LDFSASVGFIHKESFMMHGHTIVKLKLKLKSEWIICVPTGGHRRHPLKIL